MELSEELLRRFPQTLQLRPSRSSRLYRLALSAPYLTLVVLGVKMLHERGLPMAWGTLLLGLFFLLASLFWMFFDAVIDPYFLSRGWHPSIQYIPSDRQLIITDLTGIQSIFRPDAQTILHLESLRAILVTCSPKGKGWMIGLRTRKGEIIRIHSSLQEDKKEVCDLAARLSAIVGQPVEIEETTSFS